MGKKRSMMESHPDELEKSYQIVLEWVRNPKDSSHGEALKALDKLKDTVVVDKEHFETLIKIREEYSHYE